MKRPRGCIIERSSTTYLLKWEGERGPDNKRRTRYETFKGTKKEAKRRLTALIASTEAGNDVDPSRMTIKDYMKHWLDARAKPSSAPKTFERYQELSDKHIVPHLGTIKLAKLKPAQIDSFYATAQESGRLNGKGGLSPRTVNHIHRLLFHALRQAVKWQMLSRNPAEAATPPKPERREIGFLEQSDVAKLLKTAAASPLYSVILLAVTTGLRRGEVLGLRWMDVSLDRAELSVTQTLEELKGGIIRAKAPKTVKSRRTVTIPSVAVDELRRHRARQAADRLRLGIGKDADGYVFAGIDGAPLKPMRVTKQFSAIVKRAGVRPVSFHGLRHSHITHLLQAGVHPKIASERAGHATVSITLDTYSHAVPGMQADAAAKIDQALRAALNE